MVDASITLYKDIGLYPDYKRSMLFDSKTQQNNWFNSISNNLKKSLIANYNKIQNTFVLHEDVGNVYEYTYVRIKDLDSSGRIYYGFVTDVVLVDDENTEFRIALDPIQTFMCEWSLGECLVAREHVDRWKTTNDLPARVTPEGEPVNGFANFHLSNLNPLESPYYAGIIAISDKSRYYAEVTDEYIEENDASRVTFLIVPLSPTGEVLYTSVIYDIGGKETGPMAYPIPSFSEFVNGSVSSRLGLDPESVIGAWVLTHHGFDIYTKNILDQVGTSRKCVNFFASNARWHIKINDSKRYPYEDSSAMPYKSIKSIGVDVPIAFIQKITPDNIKQVFVTETALPFSAYFDKPRKPPSVTVAYSDIYEPVLFMAPYRTRGVVSNGTQILEVPDNIFFSEAVIRTYISTVISTQDVYQQIYVYGKSIDATNKQSVALMGGVGKNSAIGTDVMNNNWLSYCLQQRESDRNTVKSAIISNTITNMIGMGYGGALVGSRANSGRNDELKEGGRTENSIPISRAGGFSRAMIRASAYGMATGLVTSAVQGWDMWNQQLAKESSIRNQPNSVAVAGTGYPLIYGKNSGLGFYEAKIDDVNYEKARDNFRYYGYMVNRVEVPNIKSRYYYNYICTLNTTIKGSLASDIKSAIATIFEKGITFFHADHSDTTEYNDYENIERSLL